MDINSTELDILLGDIEKIRRRKIVDFDSIDEVIYIDPNGYIPKLKVHNNHLIFGRRGSGKTTLMLAAIKDNNSDITIIQDAQTLRNLDYNEIIIKIVLRILDEIKSAFMDIELKSIQSIYKQQYLGISGIISKLKSKREVSVKDRYIVHMAFLNILSKLIDTTKNLENMPAEIKYKIAAKTTMSSSKQKQYKEEVDIKQSLSLDAKFKLDYKSVSATIDNLNSITSSRVFQSAEELTQQDKTEITTEDIKTIKKEELLNSIKETIYGFLNTYYSIKGRYIVLYLDDFYLIPSTNQPNVLQYFHDVYKNCTNSCFCFKVCSLPFRLRMNLPGQVDFSYKDDFSPIKLDTDLSELNNRKDYLVKILCAIKPSLKLTFKDIDSLFNNDEVILYSVIATGGIPRDFLVMFADLIRTARVDNSNTILKEHVYSVINDLKEDKENNIEYDSDIDPDTIRNAIKRINDEVVETMKTNVILYPSALAQKDEVLLKNLINLRYLHVIKDSTSSENRKKEEFVAYLIDMIFYATNKRMKQGFTFRKFWEKDNKSRLKDLDSAPIWSFSKSNEGTS